MAKFSELLYELRKEKNLTQSELAEKLGITNKAVSKWETGEAMPDTAQLLPLAEILGVSVDELLRGERRITEEEKAPQERDELFADHDTVRFSSGKDTVDIFAEGRLYQRRKSRAREKNSSRTHFGVYMRSADCRCDHYLYFNRMPFGAVAPAVVYSCVCRARLRGRWLYVRFVRP